MQETRQIRCVTCKKFHSNLISKIALFYVCLGSSIPIDFNSTLHESINKINSLKFKDFRGSLLPLLHRGIHFETDKITNVVSEKLRQLFSNGSEEFAFLSDFNKKIFSPEKLFGIEIGNSLSSHPMALWKMSNLKID